jgi:2-phosphosulfolactate phosphatase
LPSNNAFGVDGIHYYNWIMNITIHHFLRGAQNATGLTVIIDVFRAFSTACYVFANGAEKIIPVGDLETAYRLKKENPDFVLTGERNGRKQAGFDYGNSPTEVEHVDLSGKTIVQTTSAGTQGLVNATKADEIITGSFVNAGAIVEYIRRRKVETVSLVEMGKNGKEEALEDTLCAEYIKSILEGQPSEFDSIYEDLFAKGAGRDFFDSAKEWMPKTDFDLCLKLNRFNFVLKIEEFARGLICLKKV